MTSFLVHAVGNGTALWVISQLPIGIYLGGWPSLVLAAVILGAVNALVRPVLTRITCLLNVLTLGLFSFVINALMLWLTSLIVTALDYQFVIDGIVPALIGAVIVGLLNAVITPILVLLFRR